MKKNNKHKTSIESNILAEEIVIGQILSDNKTREYIIENTISSFFALEKCKKIYCHCKDYVSKESSITYIVNQLWDQKLLTKIGGITQIIKLVSRSQALLAYYDKYNYIQYCIRILRNNYNKRLFIQYSYSILQLSCFYRISIHQIQQRARKYLEAVCARTQIDLEIQIRKNIGGFLRKISDSSKDCAQILSGFRELDRITHGFKDGELIVIAGRPSMGKTSFAINIAYHSILNVKVGAHIFSLEMSKDEILNKIVALASGVSIQKIQQRAIEGYEWEKIQKACKFLISCSLHISDKKSSSVSDIREQYLYYFNKKKLL